VPDAKLRGNDTVFPDRDGLVGAFLARVRATLDRYAMVRPGERVLVAVSGGPDSTALLDALWRLASEGGFGLAVAHFNHGLRGEAADCDEAHVRELAAGYGLELICGRGDAEEAARVEGRGLEAAARRLRHDFLLRAAAELGCGPIALGHTASDRVETLILNLLRGCGVAGLRGIPPVRRPFVRPLIALWRHQVEAYCNAAGLRTRADASNLDTERFLRNRVRHELLPLLEREYRAGAAEALLRCAEAVEEELEWTEPAVREALEAARACGDRPLSLSVEALRAMREGLLFRVLRAGAEEAFGDVRDWRWEHFAALADAVRRAETGHRVSLPGGLEALVSYGRLIIGPRRAEPAAIEERPLAVPGEVELPETGAAIRARVVPRAEAPPAGPDTAILDAALADGLTVRGWRPGDRFVPLGMTGHKKLQDFFTDEKVPAHARAAVALVTHPASGIIWVAGMRIAQTAKAPADAAEVLVLEMLRRSGDGRGNVSLDGEG